MAAKVAVTLTHGVGGGNAPTCPHCEKSDKVRRMWQGRRKMWYCDRCFQVTTTTKKEATLAQRLLHRLPEADTVSYSEVFQNRAMRRRQRGRR